jgi:proline iminopeptidase
MRAVPRRSYPHAWRDFLAPLALEEQADPIAGYTRVFAEATPFVRYQAARAWNLWETRLASRQPDLGSISDGSPSHDLAFATIEHHYVAHRCFISPNAILDHADALGSIPIELVHGVEDHVCPLTEVRLLHASLDDARLTMIADGGHSARHPAMISALVEATRLMALRYGHGRDARPK